MFYDLLHISYFTNIQKIKPTNLSTENNSFHKPNTRINKLLNIVQNSRHFICPSFISFLLSVGQEIDDQKKKNNILAIKQSSLTYFSVLHDHNSPNERNERALRKKNHYGGNETKEIKPRKTIWEFVPATIEMIYFLVESKNNSPITISEKLHKPIRSISYMCGILWWKCDVWEMFNFYLGCPSQNGR